MIETKISSSEYIKFLASADYIDRLISILQLAERKIHFQFYIFENDPVGQKIVQVLKNKAKKGVKVYLLFDAFGSSTLTKKFFTELRNAGIEVDFFRPLLPFYNKWGFGHRLHRKAVVVDQKYMLVGGINISQRFFKNKSQVDWLDFAIESNSSIAIILDRICENTWIHRNATKGKEIQKLLGQHLFAKSEIQVRENYWLENHRHIFNTYHQQISKAEKHIVIFASYFFPGGKIMNALIRAKRRGVKIEIILGRKSDVPLMYFASRRLYRKLLRNKIEIYEYEPSIVHAKVCAIDSQWITVGSYNLDQLSKYGNLELNVEVTNPTFVRYALKVLETYKKDCKEVEAISFSRRPSLIRVLEWLSYKILQGIFILPIFYTKGPGKKKRVS